MQTDKFYGNKGNILNFFIFYCSFYSFYSHSLCFNLNHSVLNGPVLPSLRLVRVEPVQFHLVLLPPLSFLLPFKTKPPLEKQNNGCPTSRDSHTPPYGARPSSPILWESLRQPMNVALPAKNVCWPLLSRVCFYWNYMLLGNFKLKEWNPISQP